MNELLEQKQSRREFLRGPARYLTLGGLLLMTGTLFAKRKAASPEEKCINLGICGGCSVFKNCGLPPALATRQNQASIVGSEKR
ncbi:TPA: hypothetical protein EYP66_05515 [Candidatus Poribacteria bacterium]|nr:hypothetical protein [Candidatus Poribacteria bacterium]